YYELGEGESPDDFGACQCGGNLNYFENMDDYDADEKRIYKTNKSKYGDISVFGSFNGLRELIMRISWLGVGAGVVFCIALLFISIIIILFLSFLDHSVIKSIYAVFILILFVGSLISGALASYISKSRDYKVGLLNGFLVGVIVSVFGSLGEGETLFLIFIEIIILGAFASFGGLIGIYARNNLFDR
ncbi:MAG TPA: hypothetical protein VK426_01635, partial [Methanobacterium sp.]|nr:hypothetical protein [Methanobacterium sp.]